jgi:hypothetical protein
MLLKILDRFDQAFGINLFRLLDAFRLFRCIPGASWHNAPLGFRFVSLIYFHVLPPQSSQRWFTCVTHSRGAIRYTAADHASDAEGNGIQAEFEAAGRIEGKNGLVKV